MSITQHTTAHRALMASLARDPETTFHRLWADQKDALSDVRDGRLSPRTAESHARTYAGLARSLRTWASSTVVESTQQQRQEAYDAAEKLEQTASALTEWAAAAASAAWVGALT